MSEIVFNMGDTVICDSCNESFPAGDARVGGLCFGSKAIGPCCAARWEADAARLDETEHIRARCPDGMTFRAWVIETLRGGAPAIVRIWSPDETDRWLRDRLRRTEP